MIPTPVVSPKALLNLHAHISLPSLYSPSLRDIFSLVLIVSTEILSWRLHSRESFDRFYFGVDLQLFSGICLPFPRGGSYRSFNAEPLVTLS